jgi:hypothetical protein
MKKALFVSHWLELAWRKQWERELELLSRRFVSQDVWLIPSVLQALTAATTMGFVSRLPLIFADKIL